MSLALATTALLHLCSLANFQLRFMATNKCELLSKPFELLPVGYTSFQDSRNLTFFVVNQDYLPVCFGILIQLRPELEKYLSSLLESLYTTV